MDVKIRIDREFWSRVIIVYYLLVGIFMFMLMRPGADVSGTLRIVIFGLVLLPAVFRTEFFPFALLCFQGISDNSFTPVLPTNFVYYLAIALAFYACYKEKSMFFVFAIIFYIYYLLCCLFHYDFQEYLSWVLVAIIICDYVKDESDIEKLFYAFLILSIFLCMLYLFHRSEFLMAYGKSVAQLERSFWINPNTFGATIAAGAVLAVAYLTNILKINKSIPLITLSAIVASLSIVVLALNASRGAFLAFTIPSMIMILLSKMKTVYKVLFVGVVVFVVYWLYVSTDVFELLMNRMEDETTGSAGNRTVIWKEKLEAFWWDQNVFHHIFGIGWTACTELRNKLSTHNDFLTAFIGYGLIGLMLFITIIVFPIIRAKKETRLSVSIIMLYLLVECSMLEPFFRGKFVVIMFYFFMLKYVMIYDNEEEMSEEEEMPEEDKAIVQ